MAVAAELLDLEAEALERRRRAPTSAWRCAGDSSISIGASSRWLSSRPARQPLHHPLEQHPLVRHVLVDDRHPLVVHGDDERVAELAERNHRPDVVRRRSPARRRSRRPAPDRQSRSDGRRSRAPAQDVRSAASCSGSSGSRPMRPPARPGCVIGRGSARRRRAAVELQLRRAALRRARRRARGAAPRGRATARGTAPPPWSGGR